MKRSKKSARLDLKDEISKHLDRLLPPTQNEASKLGSMKPTNINDSTALTFTPSSFAERKFILKQIRGKRLFGELSDIQILFIVSPGTLLKQSNQSL